MNRLLQNNETSIVANVSVTESRAPTDESVRLLREMEIKAKEEIIKAIRVQDNCFSCVVHQKFDYLHGETQLAIIYSVNGEKVITNFSISPLDKVNNKWIPKLIESVAKDLACHILERPVTEAMKAVRL